MKKLHDFEKKPQVGGTISVFNFNLRTLKAHGEAVVRLSTYCSQRGKNWLVGESTESMCIFLIPQVRVLES